MPPRAPLMMRERRAPNDGPPSRAPPSPLFPGGMNEAHVAWISRSWAPRFFCIHNVLAGRRSRMAGGAGQPTCRDHRAPGEGGELRISSGWVNDGRCVVGPGNRRRILGCRANRRKPAPEARGRPIWADRQSSSEGYSLREDGLEIRPASDIPTRGLVIEDPGMEERCRGAQGASWFFALRY